MNKEEALKLLDKYLHGDCSPEEMRLVEQAYHKLIDDENTVEPSQEEYESSKALVLSRIQDHYPVRQRPVRKLWPRIAAAVAAIAMLSLGFWLYDMSASRLSHDPALESIVSTVKPGRKGATIILSNGQVIELDSAKSGVVIGDVLTYDDGEALASENKGSLATLEMTARTAKGQTYEFTLPDGTRVWLNADSKISFNQDFVRKTRDLQLEGEAYFEVAKNKKVPFIVNSEAQQIEVLGTHFNVNTYADAELKLTTLLEGSVKINGVLLAPNEEALQHNGKVRIRKTVASDAVDWTRGDFICKEERLDQLMKRISRWYNVEVAFDNEGLKKQTFSGSLSRYDSIGSLLEGLKYAGIHSRLEGNTIKIIP